MIIIFNFIKAINIFFPAFPVKKKTYFTIYLDFVRIISPVALFCREGR